MRTFTVTPNLHVPDVDAAFEQAQQLGHFVRAPDGNVTNIVQHTQ